MPSKTKELDIDINSTLALPTNLKYINYNNVTLCISVDTANWIILENEEQIKFFKKLYKHSIKEAIERTGLHIDNITEDINKVLTQIFAKDFCNTHVVSKHPGSLLQLYLTNSCNLRCPHCYMFAGNPLKNELSCDEIYKILDSFAKNSGNKVILTGGEVMLRKDLKRIISRCKQYNLIVEVLSNGLLWSEDFIKWSIGKIDQIQISIDGYNEATNAKIRGKGNFSIALNTIEKLLKYNSPTRLAITPIYSEDLRNQIYHYCNFAKELIKKYEDKPFGISFSGDLLDGRFGALTPQQHDYYISCVREIESHLYGTSENSSFIESIKNHIIADNCAFGQISIAANGDIYLCPYVTNINSIGNIRTFGYDRLFQLSTKASQCSNINNLMPCRNCELKYICGGGCRIKHFSYLKEGFIPHDSVFCYRKCDEGYKHSFYKLMIETNTDIFH